MRVNSISKERCHFAIKTLLKRFFKYVRRKREREKDKKKRKRRGKDNKNTIGERKVN